MWIKACVRLVKGGKRGDLISPEQGPASEADSDYTVSDKGEDGNKTDKNEDREKTEDTKSTSKKLKFEKRFLDLLKLVKHDFRKWTFDQATEALECMGHIRQFCRSKKVCESCELPLGSNGPSRLICLTCGCENYRKNSCWRIDLTATDNDREEDGKK